MIASVADLLEALTEAERIQRKERGLPEDHVLDLREFPFHFALSHIHQFDAWSARQIVKKPENGAIWMCRAVARFALKDYDGANAAMAKYEAISPHERGARTRFGIAPPKTSLELPRVTGVYPRNAALFLSCDGAYFNTFAMPLLRSIAQTGPGTPVHLHIMSSDVDVGARTRDLALTITSTFEDPERFIATHEIKAAEYFCATRFIRFAEALEISDGPLWMMDVDALAIRSPQPLFSAGGDVAVRLRAGRVEPWNQFSGCLVMGRPGGRPYFRRVADIIRAELTHAWWGLDQCALLSAYIGIMPELTLVGPDLAGLSDCPENAMFWFYSGRKKWSGQEDQGPYGNLLRKYLSET